VVDEWSCALTPQSLANEPDEAAARQDFCTAQMEVYSTTTAGWSFWAYKKEGCDTDPSWCFTSAVGTSLPSDFFVYKEACNSRRSIGSLISLPSRSEALSMANGSILSSSPVKRSPTVSPDLDPKRSIPLFHHRLAAIHYRRSKRDSANMTAEQQSSARGYSDGYLTARLFCQYDGSQLGFVGQYIQDSISALGSEVIAPGTEPYYSAGFTRGLSDGEGR
jgi:glucan 1,3-beta-glucosidase